MKIVVTTRIPGVHRWQACPIPEVEYLKNYHRHMFHIKVWKKVEHDDRDVEIIMFKRDVKAFIRENYFDIDHDACFFGDMSCEMIAKMVYHEFSCEAVEVLEDGENGALYEGLEL